ncbi:MAG TPA: FAD-dependent oxidoreductase [Candidatus Limnocylindrales bacterium]|nr:FAD-dependent oxidoreductase [Candidatus Limnocylindrales bacterium]
MSAEPRQDRYDVIVVGAGAAGCVVARRLADRGLQIIVLEAGPELPVPVPADWRDGWRLPTVPDWGYTSEPTGSADGKKLRRGRVIGGTSWLTRFAVRGATVDFDGWAASGNAGWSYDEVLPVFRRIETDAEYGDTPWHGGGGPIPVTRYLDLPRSPIHAAAIEALEAVGITPVEDHNAPGVIGVGPIPMSSRDGRRVTTADGYLPDGQRPPHLTVRTDAAVASVVIDGDRAIGVRLADGTVIAAGGVVVSGGTYGSPTLLLRSGIGPADHLSDLGIPVVQDLPGVGSNLADHPGVDLDSGWRGTGVTGPVLHTIATLRSSSAGPDGAPDLMFWVSDPVGDEDGLYLDPILLKPDSRGTVRLRSGDPADAPLITLPGIQAARDVERLAEGYRLGLEIAAQPSLRRLATDAAPSGPATATELKQRLRENVYSIPHVVGTCAMGPAPEAGAVVDADGRVHGVAGLRVVDASIIPEPLSGFPHLVTIMVAERLADRFVSSL